MKARFAVFLVITLLVFPMLVQAEEIPLFYKGIRPLGMGGAFTAVADDENAIFYNPAGLLQEKGRESFEILPPLLSTFEIGSNLVDRVQEVKQIASLPVGAEKTNRFIDLVGGLFGDSFHLKTSFFPNIIYDRVGVGFLAQADVSGTIHNPLASNAIEGYGKGDLALLVSYARPVEVKTFPIYTGLTVKGVNRHVIDRSYTLREITETKLQLEDDIKEGTGMALDVGLLYPMEGFLVSSFFKSVALKPTIGLSLQNIVGGDMGDAGKLPFQANLGVALEQKVKRGDLLFAADIVDMTYNLGTDNDFVKRLHIGMEYRFPYILTLRTGLYQGNPSFGTAIDLWVIHFVYAYYVEEIGAFSGQISDPRHVIKFSFF